MLLCHITTQIKGEKHGDLLQKKGGDGFPHIVILDADGALLAVHDADRNIEGFGATVKQAREFLDLKKRADGGERKAQVEFFMKACEIRHFTLAEAQKRAKALPPLADAQKKKVGELLAGMEVGEILAAVDGEDAKSLIEGGRRCAEMKKAGRVPRSDADAEAFWQLIMAFAESKKDAALFEEALGALKKKFGDQIDPDWLAEQEKKLAELKKK